MNWAVKLVSSLEEADWQPQTARRAQVTHKKRMIRDRLHREQPRVRGRNFMMEEKSSHGFVKLGGWRGVEGHLEGDYVKAIGSNDSGTLLFVGDT